jgi:restriction system protein
LESFYHYPPELFQLLVDTIPRLSKGKQDVILFFRGAGVPESFLELITDRISADPDFSKFHIARALLAFLNEGGDRLIAARRLLLKRVTEFEDFSTCWPGDQLKAKGLISEIRRVINVKDSFTRITQEREKDAQALRDQKQAEWKTLDLKRTRKERIKKDLGGLFGTANPHARGKNLEKLLNELFSHYGILVRESFTLRIDGVGIVEQIDGVVELDGQLYLVEVKWHSEPLGVESISQHQVRVFHRSQCRGIIISASGFTRPAILSVTESLKHAVFVLCELEEIVSLLDGEVELKEFLKNKINAAVLDKNPFLKISQPSSFY